MARAYTLMSTTGDDSEPLTADEAVAAFEPAGTLAAFKAAPSLGTLVNAANDVAAAAGGVAIGSLYRNGSVLMIRVA